MINCRSCNGETELVVSLGYQYLSSFPNKLSERGTKLPLELIKCKQCNLVQLSYTVDPKEMFSHFWYQSGISSSMRYELKNIVDSAMRQVVLKQSDVVLDIGCNDGTIFDYYPDCNKVGFEPATNMAQKAKEKAYIFNHFFQSYLYRGLFHKAKIITTIAMYYDIDNPNLFTKEVAECLDEDGVWINQMNYLPTMLNNNNYDNICHEHLTYYSLFTLLPILRANGLDCYRVETNDVNGGSFRCYIAHTGKHERDITVERVLEYERRLGLRNKEPYFEFAKRILEQQIKLHRFLFQCRNDGKKVFVYGASTRGNILLQYCGIDKSLVDYAVDANVEKWGRHTITGIPIISKTEGREMNPDYWLVLPYHFINEIRAEEKGTTAKYIVPLPRLRVI